MSVVIIDYGMGNLGSVKRAFEECGADVRLIDDPRELAGADHIVLPGVGAFSKGMQNLREGGWVEAIRKEVLENNKPILGICLGMQLLATKGFEGGECDGLDLIKGQVIRFENSNSNLRIPHVGWNEINITSKESELFSNISSGTDFYFVHSYYFVCQNPSEITARTPYAGDFASVVSAKNIFGVQFHPEKSQKPGFKLIQNFLKVC